MKKLVSVQKKILDSKSYVDLGIELGITDPHDFLCFLFNYVQTTIKSKEIDKYNGLTKAVEYLNTIAFGKDNPDTFLIVEKVRQTRIQAVNKIKSISKKERKNSTIVKVLREVANDLEAIEVEIRYDVNADFIKTNADIIKYILFKEKNIEISEDLIDNHPYLINLCNEDNENIVELVINRYLQELNNYIEDNGSRRCVQYYDEILTLILKKEKIKTDSMQIEKSIMKIKKWQATNANNLEMMVWLNHLFKKLDNPNYLPSKQVYDLMYGIDNKVNNEISILCPNVEIKNDDRFKTNSECLITIDDKDVSARDDAFSITKKENGNYLIGIHFADVNYFCSLYPEIREISRKRMQNVYLPDGVINMIPYSFANNYLSLDENKKRFARSIYLEVDKYGQEVSFEIKKSTVRIDRNFSFQEANRIIKHNSSHKWLDELFESLLIVEPMLKRILFNKFTSAPQTSEKIIETLMVYPSYKVASFFKENDYPFLYKSHILNKSIPQPLQQRLDSLDQDIHCKYIDIIEENQNVEGHSYFSVEPLRHDGINLACYSRYTSPIREYAGIVVNDCLDSFYFNQLDDQQTIDEIREHLKSTADYLNSRGEELQNYAKGYSRIRKK